MSKIRFNYPRKWDTGRQVKLKSYGYMSVDLDLPPTYDRTELGALWYGNDQNRWAGYEDLTQSGENHISSASKPVKSLRAFRRRFRQWKNQVPAGTTFILVGRYVGSEIYAQV